MCLKSTFKNVLKSLLFCCLFIAAMTNIKAQTFTTLDDFSDGNFNANPVWTPSSGTWQVSSGVLQVAGSSGTYRIATPFTKVCNAWEFRFDLDGSGFTGQKVEYYFFMTSASSNPSTANGYRVSYNITSNTATNTILLENLTNGVANTIVTFSNMSGDQNIRVTRENNLWKLFTAGILRGSGTDATYAPQNSAFQGALITIPSGGAVNYNHGIDNIRFAEFIPPTLNAQYNGEESKSICNGAGYTLTANPVGGSNCWMASANWEYAWYTGTGTDATYWNGSTWTNAENYSSTYVSIPNVAPSATTTYKVKVRCSADAASGVGLDPTGVTVTVAPQPVAPELTKNPNTASVCQNTSITITTGGGSGGVEGTNTDEYRYSTDNGVNWTALSSTIPVFNAVTGTNIIQSRRVSTGAGCNTSSSNQVSWTVNALTSNTTTVNATNSYVWAVNGQTYTSSGNYQSVNGCNTEILNLTINTTSVNAGIFESFAIINFGGANVFYDLNANTGNTDFNSVSLGNYNSGNTLILKGAQNKIFKCTGFDITNGKLLYRIYKSGNTPGTFNEVNLPFASNDAGAGDGCQNQTWQEANANINLLSGLCDGDYTIEVFTQADYTGNGGGIIYANNGGNYYKASFSINNSQQSGIYESYINFKSGNTTSFYNLNGSPVSTLPNFNGLNLGSFCPNASLIISGGENKTYKCPANDVVNGKLFYRIYPGTTASGSFTEINLPFKENIDGAQCNNGQNQIWQSLTNTTNILTGLTPGTYTIEVYSQADYNSNGICPGSHFSSNGGANYKASFTVLTLNTYYQDNDGDGYGTDNTTSACSKPAGYATQGGDCNDNNAAINPGATEICNNIDDNCDGQIDEGVKPAEPAKVNCWDNYVFDNATCQWVNNGTQPEQPATACYEIATFNTTTCQWEVTGTQPEQPATACYEIATFNTTTCQWDVTGTQPEQPRLACYESATFNTTSCSWDVSGTQPEQPSLACYESATFNTTSCSWDVTGTQPEQPSLACYETATFNTTSCDWDVTGTQPTKPATACYETATFNTTSCDWDVTGTQPTKPATACYETATFNTQTCKWDVTGTQPTQPSIACYETATFNGTSCQWVVTGTQPTRPNTACYETATFNTQTCKWDVTGTQPQQPTLACYESANFNTTTCSWVVTGTKPQEPAKVNCWDNYVFNTNQCKWINTGTPNLVSIIISSDEGKFSASSNTIDFNAPVPSSYSITFKASPIANGGSNPTYTWKRNGITVGTNSNTYTGTGWSNGETIQCILTSNATCVSGNPALSNTVSIRVTLPNYFVVSDKEADRIFYYDADFNLVRSNPISSKKEVNAEDIWAISSDVYVLSGSEQRVYRINGSATTSSVSRKLRNTDGKNLKSLSGLAIIGNHLLVVEDKSEFIYRYNLDDAYNGTSNYNALQRIALNKDNKDAEALGYDAANNIIYVLDNDREKTIFRYPVTSLTASRISVGNATRSRKMKSQNGAGIKKALGLAVDQTFIRITDQGPDRAYTYRIADLFAGNNSGNLNALSVNSLNGQNKYSTGISLFYSPVPLVSNISTPFVKKANDQYSIPNTTSAIDLRVLGNPSSTYFRLQPVSSDKKQRMVIRVMDVNGRIMEQFDQLKEGQTLQIGGAYRQGLYFAELIQGKQRKVVRLIKGN